MLALNFVISASLRGGDSVVHKTYGLALDDLAAWREGEPEWREAGASPRRQGANSSMKQPRTLLLYLFIGLFAYRVSFFNLFLRVIVVARPPLNSFSSSGAKNFSVLGALLLLLH